MTTVSKVLESLLPVMTILVGLLSKVLLQLLRRGVGAVDRLPATQKRIALVVIAAGLTIASRLLPGVEIPTDLASWDVNVISGLLSVGVAHLVHKAEHAKSTAANQ